MKVYIGSFISKECSAPGTYSIKLKFTDGTEDIIKFGKSALSLFMSCAILVDQLNESDNYSYTYIAHIDEGNTSFENYNAVMFVKEALNNKKILSYMLTYSNEGEFEVTVK